MTAERYQRVKEVFLAVLERPEAEWDAASAEMCAQDSELQSEVISLLASHRHAEQESNLEPPEQKSDRTQFLTQPDILLEEAPSDESPAADGAGAKIPGKTPGKSLGKTPEKTPGRTWY